MMKPSLKSQATSGVIWSAVEKLLAQGGHLISGIILARILMPEDFGLIGMLTIFIVIATSLVNGGLGSGLIQKRNRTDIDFSTVFLYNLTVSLILYLLLFVTAPLIAAFYEIPRLVSITRVFSLNIVIGSLSIVHRTQFIINIDFKTIAKVNTVSVISGGLIGILFAFRGFGVWALVVQNLVQTTVSVFMFWILSGWRPLLFFSKQSFKDLFGFGSKILIATILAQTISKIYNIVIGKVYSSASVGFYTSASSFAVLSAETVTNVLQQVSYPILAILQDERERLINAFSRLVSMTTFLVFPLMTLVAILADPLIRLVLTDKWIEVVPLLQWMCFANALHPISSINMNILNATGRSEMYLKLDLIKLPFIIIAFIITIPLGVKAIVIGQVVTAIIAFLINGYMSGRLFGYGIGAQLKDMLPVFFVTAITALFVYVVNIFFESTLLKLVSGILTGIVVYLGFSYILKIKELNEVKILIKNLMSRNE